MQAPRDHLTHRRTRIVGIAIAALVFVGASCSSSDDTTSNADRTTVTSDASGRGAGEAEPPSTSVHPPEGWPEGIAMPEGIELGPIEETTREGTRVLRVTGTIRDADENAADVFAWITANLIDMGYSLANETSDKPEGPYSASVTGVKDDHLVNVVVTVVDAHIRVDYEVEPDA